MYLQQRSSQSATHTHNAEGSYFAAAHGSQSNGVPMASVSQAALTLQLPGTATAVQTSTAVHEPQPELPSGDLSIDDLSWQQSSDGSELVAWIPESRLADFIEGEESRGYCKLVRQGVSQSQPGSERKRNVRKDTKLYRAEYICDHGPQDLRGAGRPAGQLGKRKSGIEHGDSKKVGCKYRFKAAIYALDPGTVEIRLLQHRHVDCKQGEGTLVHGPGAQVSNLRLLQMHHMPDSVKQHIIARKTHKVPNLAIYNEIQKACVEEVKVSHPQLTDGQARALLQHQAPREHSITRHDVNNIALRLARDSYRKDENDVRSVQLLVEKNKDKIICHQSQKCHWNAAGQVVQDAPFIIGVMTDHMTRQLALNGHGAAVILDTTHGLVKYMFPFLSMLVMDDWLQGVPGAWAMLSNEQEPTLMTFFDAVKGRVESLKPDWRPSCFIIDDCQAFANALRQVWPGVPVNLCIWHVKKAWVTNLVSKVRNLDDREAMFKDLSAIMHGAELNQLESPDELLAAVKVQMQQFCSKWSYYSGFKAYFETEWMPRPEMWVLAFRQYAHDQQSGTQAVEGYQGSIKHSYFRGQTNISGRRMDWFLTTLLEEIEPEYQRRAAMRNMGYQHKARLESLVDEAAKIAAYIPDCLIGVHELLHRVMVASLSRHGYAHEVLHPNTVGSTCTCEKGKRGLVCSHQMCAAMAVSGLSSKAVGDRFISGDIGLAARKPGLVDSQLPPAAPPIILDQRQLRRQLDQVWRQRSGITTAAKAPSWQLFQHSQHSSGTFVNTQQQQQQQQQQSRVQPLLASNSGRIDAGSKQQPNLPIAATNSVSTIGLAQCLQPTLAAHNSVVQQGGDASVVGASAAAAAGSCCSPAYVDLQPGGTAVDLNMQWPDTSTGGIRADDACGISPGILGTLQYEGLAAAAAAGTCQFDQISSIGLTTTSSDTYQPGGVVGAAPAVGAAAMELQQEGQQQHMQQGLLAASTEVHSFVALNQQRTDVRRRSCLENASHTSRARPKKSATPAIIEGSRAPAVPVEHFAVVYKKRGKKAAKTWTEKLGLGSGAAAGSNSPAPAAQSGSQRKRKAAPAGPPKAKRGKHTEQQQQVAASTEHAAAVHSAAGGPAEVLTQYVGDVPWDGSYMAAAGAAAAYAANQFAYNDWTGCYMDPTAGYYMVPAAWYDTQ